MRWQWPEVIPNSLPACNYRSRSKVILWGGGETGWKKVAALFKNLKVLNRSSLVFQGVGNGEYPLGISLEYAGPMWAAGGMLTTDNEMVRGDNATSRITSRTNVATATTQTTIVFDTAGNSTSHLVTTVSGPLSAPELDTTRTAANK